MADLEIRWAKAADLDSIFSMIHDMAAYEGLEHELSIDSARLHDALFGPWPTAEVIVGELDGAVVSYAIFYQTFKTYACLPGIYMDNIYVAQEARGAGVGYKMLCNLAAIAKCRGYFRVEWAVRNANAEALRAYDAYGAERIEGQTKYRLQGRVFDDMTQKFEDWPQQQKCNFGK